MRIPVLSFVLALAVSVTPAAAQASDGGSFFVTGSLASTSFFSGTSGDTALVLTDHSDGLHVGVDALSGTSIDLGFGALLLEHLAVEFVMVRKYRGEGTLDLAIPEGILSLPESEYRSSMGAYLFGTRHIAPVADRLNLYGGILFGRYGMDTDLDIPDLLNDTVSTSGTAMRFRGGTLWGLGPQIHLGLELHYTMYNGMDRGVKNSELGTGAGIMVRF